jgi:hypothetical protein
MTLAILLRELASSDFGGRNPAAIMAREWVFSMSSGYRHGHASSICTDVRLLDLLRRAAVKYAIQISVGRNHE